MPHKHIKDGEVYFTNQPDGSDEYLPADDPEVIASLEPPELTNEEIYDQTMQNNKLIKALALSLNDAGAFSSTGGVLSNADLKALVKSNM